MMFHLSYKKAIIKLSFVFFAIFCFDRPAYAGISDWFTFKSAGENAGKEVAGAIDRASLNLFRLQDDFDIDIREYITELDRISEARLQEATASIGRNIGDIDEIISETLKDIQNVQNRAYFDAKDIIRQAQCLGEQYSQTLKETLKDSIEIISESEAIIKIPILGEARLLVEKVNIKNPYEAYETAKKSLLANLDQISEDDSALTVFAQYGELYRLAMKTSCHYQGNPFEKYFFAEMANYSGKSAHWAILTGLDQY